MKIFLIEISLFFIGTPKAWVKNGLKNGGNGVSILYAAKEIKRHLGGRNRKQRGVGPSKRYSMPNISSPREHISVSSITTFEIEVSILSERERGSRIWKAL